MTQSPNRCIIDFAKKIFLVSSAVEHPAVNRRVVCSNQTRGAIKKSVISYDYGFFVFLFSLKLLFKLFHKSILISFNLKLSSDINLVKSTTCQSKVFSSISFITSSFVISGFFNKISLIFFSVYSVNLFFASL